MPYNFDKVLRLTDPSTEPLTLAEAKEHLRYDGTVEDDYITALIGVARDHIEQFTGQYWAKATFAVFFDDFPSGNAVFDIVVPGIESVDTITYIDTNNDSQSITSGTTLDSERRALFYSESWPTDAISVRLAVTAGTDNGASPADIIPNAIIQAIKLVLTDLFNNRADVTNMQTYNNKAAEMLAYPYRTRMGV